MRRLFWGSLLFAATALVPSSDAQACGGCFIPPVQGNDNGTIVTSHRMALSISGDQTILWDQIQYTGNPAEFAWILPVKPGASIELASEAWFDVLDAATGTQVTPPLLECAGGSRLGCSVVPGGVGVGSNFGCGASEVSGPGTGPIDDPVQVVHHGATGPYESVIIHSDTPGALTQWLQDHNYVIPNDITPVIEAYQSEGFDFAALRLLPSSGIQQMRPVRVVQEGAAPVLPLRMVAAGTGARTAITLFVIGEGRYTTNNFKEQRFPRELVTWDYQQERSNYSLIRDKILGEGYAWFTPYAEPGALFDAVPHGVRGYPLRYQTTNGWEFSTLAEAFVEQAFVNGETSSTDCADFMALLADDDRRVVMPCDEQGNPECIVDTNTEINAHNLECDPPLGSNIPLDDLAQAMIGMHPSDVWITRLEANLVRPALANDLSLRPADDQSRVPGAFEAGIVTNITPSCRLPEDENAALFPVDAEPERRPPSDGPMLIGLGLAALLFFRRLAGRLARRRAVVLTREPEVVS